MLINIWISFLFSNRLAVVWANLHPAAVATQETVRAKTELEFVCSIPRAQTIPWAERGDVSRLWCPQTWYSSMAFSLYPVEGNRGCAYSHGPPVWEPAELGRCGVAPKAFSLITAVSWGFCYQAVVICTPALSVLGRDHGDSQLLWATCFGGWLHSEEGVGPGTSWSSECSAHIRPPHLAFCYRRIQFFISTGRSLLDRSRTFLSSSSWPATPAFIAVNRFIQAFLLFLSAELLSTKELC